MRSSTRSKAGLLSALAAVAATISPSRVGTASPGASSPLAAAPAASQGQARATNARRLRRSLRACIAEGLVAEVIAACAGSAILTAWAIYLNASALVTGALVALAQMAQLFQFPAAWTTSWLGPRRASIILVAASRQVTLPLVALPFLPLSDGARQGVLVTVAALAAALGVLGNNAWVSWMSDLVPKRVRGRYFGRRTALCTLGGALASAAAAVLLDAARARALTGPALALLQVVGSAGGIAATALMLRQHDPGGERAPLRLGWTRALAPLRDPAARGLLAYLAVWNGAVGLAGSFFPLHMLRNLKMSFTLVALHGTALAVVRMVAAPIWGGLLDRFGARPVLLACSFGISAIPFAWLFPTEDFLWPLAFDALSAGILWCGHALAMFNLPLTITPRRERPFYLAAFATVSGLTFSLATLAGGLLAEALPDRFELCGYALHDLQVLFVLSGALRLGAAFVSLRIHEPASHGVHALWSAVVARLSWPRPALISLRARASAANEGHRRLRGLER